MIFRKRKSVFYTFFLFFLFSTLFLSSTFAYESKNVLYINSYHFGYTWSDSIISGLFSVLSTRKDVIIYTEFMDRKRFDDKDYEGAFKTLFLSKYKSYQFDVIAVSDNSALNFVLSNYNELFKGVPIVFSGIANPEEYSFANLPVFGVVEFVSLEEELEIIFKLRPKMKNIYIITDKTSSQNHNKNIIQATLNKLNKNVCVNLIDQFDRDILMDQVQKMNPDDALYLASMSLDRFGNPLDMTNEAVLMSRISKVPIFGNFSNLPSGTVTGGQVLLGRMHGILQANMINKILDHKESEIQTKIIWPEVQFAIDYQLMIKYGISQYLISENIKIYNKSNSIFEKYKNQITYLLIVYLILITTIVFLIITLRQKKKAGRIIKEQIKEIKHKNYIINENYQSLNDSNVELEVVNEELNRTNENLEKAKLQAEESDKLKSFFLYNIYHEIRTPLNSIIGFADLVTKDGFKGRDKENFYKIIKINSSHLLNTINNIIEFSKLQSGDYKYKQKKINLYDIVQSLNTMYLNECSFYEDFKTNIIQFNLVFPIDSDTFYLNNDIGFIQQIFSVLLNNAIKFTNSGFIEVGFRFEDGKGLFYVKDTGVGIKKEKFATIYNSFWKATASDTNEAYRGVGIGLSMVSQLVKIMHGELWIESIENKGTTVYFKLPVERITKNILDKSPSISEESDCLKGKRILLPEDLTETYNYLKMLLDSVQMSIVSIYTSEELFDVLHDQKIDLVVLDFELRSFFTWELFGKIKKINPSLPIIALIAEELALDDRLYIESKFDAVLQQPIVKDDLYALLLRLFS